jgi:hypothetical protein
MDVADMRRYACPRTSLLSALRSCTRRTLRCYSTLGSKCARELGGDNLAQKDQKQLLERVLEMQLLIILSQTVV